MTRPNPSLAVGTALCLVMLFLALFPETVTRQSPYAAQAMISRVEDGELQFYPAPFAPSRRHVMGSDDLGRDIWSQIAFGTRLTLGLGLLAVAGRFLIAMPLALSAGFGNSIAQAAIRQSGVLFSAIPSLLISIVILKQELFIGLEKGASILAFTIVLSAVGWAKLATLIAGRTQDILRQPFILSERAVGKTPWKIALENVLPHLAPELTVLFFMEISRVLSLVMQLGIFGIFVGNLRIINSTDGGFTTFIDISFEPEWASMLGTARNRISTAPWMVVAPAFMFFVSVIGFNLLGEGLRHWLQQDRSSALVDLKDRRTRRFKVLGGLSALMAAVLIIGNLGPLSRRTAGGAMAADRLPEGPILNGSPEARAASEAIAETMASAGLEPLYDGRYFHEYPVASRGRPLAFEFTVESPSGHLAPEMGTDYAFLEMGGPPAEGPLYDAAGEDLLSIDDYRRFDGSVVLVDTALYNPATLQWIVENLTEKAEVAALLLCSDDPAAFAAPSGFLSPGPLVAVVGSDLAMALRSLESPSLRLSVQAEALENLGRNVGGILRGTDPFVADKAVLVAVGYNSNGPGAQGLPGIWISLMEELAAAGNNKRSILFLFLDSGGLMAYEDSLPFNPADIELSLDLTSVAERGFHRVVCNAEQAPITRYYAWSFSRLFSEALKARGLPTTSLAMGDRGGEAFFPDDPAANLMFWGHGVANLRIGTDPADTGDLDPGVLKEVLLDVFRENRY